MLLSLILFSYGVTTRLLIGVAGRGNVKAMCVAQLNSSEHTHVLQIVRC